MSLSLFRLPFSFFPRVVLPTVFTVLLFVFLLVMFSLTLFFLGRSLSIFFFTKILLTKLHLSASLYHPLPHQRNSKHTYICLNLLKFASVLVQSQVDIPSQIHPVTMEHPQTKKERYVMYAVRSGSQEQLILREAKVHHFVVSVLRQKDLKRPRGWQRLCVCGCKFATLELLELSLKRKHGVSRLLT